MVGGWCRPEPLQPEAYGDLPELEMVGDAVFLGKPVIRRKDRTAAIASRSGR